MTQQNGTALTLCLRRVNDDPPAGDLLEVAELLGEVELKTGYFDCKRECKITIGDYGDARIDVWGKGQNTHDALKDAIRKAKTITEALAKGAQ